MLVLQAYVADVTKVADLQGDVAKYRSLIFKFATVQWI